VTDGRRVGTAEMRNVRILAGYKRCDNEKKILTLLKKFEIDNVVEGMICYV